MRIAAAFVVGALVGVAAFITRLYLADCSLGTLPPPTPIKIRRER